MTGVVQDEAATMFLDRRLLHVAVPGFDEELYDTPMPARGCMLVSVPHGCLVIARDDVDTLVRARVFSEPPQLDGDVDVDAFDVVGGQVVITNPLWAGPPGQIVLSLADGRWSVAVAQAEEGGPLCLSFWRESPGE